MWLERFVIVITSLHRDLLPSSWGEYYPTRWDWAVFVGTIGFFLTLMFLFMRVLPAISIFEMREVLHHLRRTADATSCRDRHTWQINVMSSQYLLGSTRTVRPHGRVRRPEELVAAAQRAYAAGYRKMEHTRRCRSKGLSEAIGFTRHLRLAGVFWSAGSAGCIGGFRLMWWITVIAYAHNVAGRPMNSWPAYIPSRSNARAAGLADRCHRHVRDERTAAAVSSGVQRSGICPSAPPSTASSCASKPRIRCSTSTKHEAFPERAESLEVAEVEK